MTTINTSLVNSDENREDFFDGTIRNSGMMHKYIPKTHTPPEILYHERVSLMDAIKSELSEDTVIFLDMLAYCKEPISRIFCTKSGKPTQASITKTCIMLGIPRIKVRRFFVELSAMYKLL